MFAVVRTGGRQYRVEQGRSVTVGRLPGDVGDTIELGDVLLMGDGDDVTLGAPAIDGARVLGRIDAQGRSPKVIVFRYKAKTRQRTKRGHRQEFTRLFVSDILAPGQEPAQKKRTTRKTAAEAAAPEPELEAAVAVATEPAVAEPAPEEPAKPKRRTRRKAEPEATE